ncbi:alpha/beta hydrolase [Nocardia yamanashiensis]|uniref:alpha/beta fold hydrolase n=1 Tax=Nocardia yamanashiensis TaxID=209247 RepID=UPI001E5CAE92|nr:alpha/beta hydrolase [Nocardia yamanashiensis]UGT38843.1 alpha/beta hydrolase [Nocardia yamanashiensis]
MNQRNLLAQFGVDGGLARMLRDCRRPESGAAEVFEYGETAPGLLRNTRTFEASTVETPDGARLHVREFGPRDGIPIVLVHGFACRVEYWNPQINRLAERHRVIAYDQRGYARSTLGTREFTPDALGDDLATVLAATVRADQRAVITGHSLGGIAVMAWAARHPEQVRRHAREVLLIDTCAERITAHTEIVPWPRWERGLRERVLNALLGRLPMPHPRLLGNQLRNRGLTPTASRAATEFTVAVVGSCPNPFRTRSMRVLRDLDVTAGLANLTVPTTVIVGSLDRLTPVSASLSIAAHLRAAGTPHRYLELPGRGHCTTVEEPETITAEIERAAATDALRGSRDVS